MNQMNKMMKIFFIKCLHPFSKTGRVKIELERINGICMYKKEKNLFYFNDLKLCKISKLLRNKSYTT